ncbi:MAG: hypothetical protein GY856_27110 [bacterium]|nr:hypothetical protein [bacterium]
MGLWIETLSARKGDTLRVAGQLVGPWVGVLERECTKLLREGTGELTVDLEGLIYLNTAGCELLSRIAKSGIRVVNCSPLIAEMVESLCGEPRR